MPSASPRRLAWQSLSFVGGLHVSRRVAFQRSGGSPRTIDEDGAVATRVDGAVERALTGGDALALKLLRGAVTGPTGIAALALVALGRRALLLVAENVAKLNPERRVEIEARLGEPGRRRVLPSLTAIIGACFTRDGARQIALALTVPTGNFVTDSTAARIVVLGTGLTITITYLRREKHRLQRASANPRQARADIGRRDEDRQPAWTAAQTL